MALATARGISLPEVSKRHYALCEHLTQDSTDLNQAAKSASKAIKVEDLHRASYDRNAAASLIWEPIGLAIERKPHSVAVDYVFYASIYVAGVEAGLEIEGPLLLMVAEHLASTLTLMIAKAVHSKNYERVNVPAELLDSLGTSLDRARYKVTARGYQALAAMGIGQRLSSSRDKLNNRMRVTQLQLEMQELIPAARVECANNEDYLQELDKWEKVANA